MTLSLLVEIPLVALGVVLVSCLVIWWHAARAPLGYEADDGFHLGKEPSPRGRRRQRRRRAGQPPVRQAVESPPGEADAVNARLAPG